MWTVVINMLMIATIVVIVYDMTDAPDRLFKPLLWHLLKGWKTPYRYFEFKPLDCSLCCSIYCNALYILITNHFTLLAILIMFLIAICTPLIKDTLYLLMDLYQRLINAIQKLINKI